MKTFCARPSFLPSSDGPSTAAAYPCVEEVDRDDTTAAVLHTMEEVPYGHEAVRGSEDSWEVGMDFGRMDCLRGQKIHCQYHRAVGTVRADNVAVVDLPIPAVVVHRGSMDRWEEDSNGAEDTASKEHPSSLLPNAEVGDHHGHLLGDNPRSTGRARWAACREDTGHGHDCQSSHVPPGQAIHEAAQIRQGSPDEGDEDCRRQ